MNTQEYIQSLILDHPEYVEAPFFLGTPFTRDDRTLIEGIKIVIPSFSSFLGKHCEVILHSFEDPLHAIIYTENASLSGRKRGDPIRAKGLMRILEAMKSEHGIQYIGKSESGHNVRAGIFPILNKNARCLGSLSLGFDMEAPFISVVQDFCLTSKLAKSSPEFGPSMNVSDIIQEAIEQIRQDSTIKRRSRIRELVRLLLKKNVFETRNAINIVASAMGTSPSTIYWHLRELKHDTSEI